MHSVYKAGHLLMSQPHNQVIEAETHFTLFLSKFKLTFIVLLDIQHINLAAKLLKHSIISAFSHHAEMSFQVIKRSDKLNL